MHDLDAIFKSYDVRGTYPSELDEDTYELLGRAFVRFFKKRNPSIGVARDGRDASASLAKAFIKGVKEEGGKAVDFGQAPTPMFYFGVASLGLDGGGMITASHNPPEYNGLKFVGKNAFALGSQSGLSEIQTIAQRMRSQKVSQKKTYPVRKKNIQKKYIAFHWDAMRKDSFEPLRVIVDLGNAVPAILVPDLVHGTPLRVSFLFQKIRGDFPNHLPNPLDPKNTKAIQQEVKKKKAHFGVAFDGDGDRLFFIDEKGRRVASDIILAFLSEVFLKEEGAPVHFSRKRQKIVYDVRCGRIVEETIVKCGGIPIKERVGRTFFQNTILEKGALFGGEFSGHFYALSHYGFEAPFFVFLKIAQEISRQKKPLSVLLDPYQKYYHSGEMNLKVPKRKTRSVLKRLERIYHRGAKTSIDGLRMDFPEWWFLVRASNTEPLLRVLLETKTKKLLSQKKKELIVEIRKAI